MRWTLLPMLLSAACVVRIVDSSTTKTMAPATLASTDIGASCSTGLALGPVLGALGDEARRPYKALTFTRLAAGMCADMNAWDAELARLGALYIGQASATHDHLIREQRVHAQAAQRYFDAWKYLDLAFGNSDLGTTCPTLNLRRNEDLLLLLGLTSGALAMLHDRAAEGSLGVPTDLPRKVERAAACLDDTKFWGVPLALQASVWALVPGSGPQDTDPWGLLEEAAERGDAANVRLGRALQVQAMATTGRQEPLKQAIRDHAASLDEQPADPAWALLDSFATALILHESDKLWMLAEGHRTPLRALGTFPDDPSLVEQSDPDLDGILENVLGSLSTPSPVDDAPDTPPVKANAPESP